MASKACLFGIAQSRILQKLINISTDSMKIMLLTGYTPNFITDSVYSDISAFEVIGTGYSATGNAIAGQTLTGPTAANSWPISFAPQTNYTLGEIVIPLTPNGYLYRCTVPGITNADATITAATNASPSVITATSHQLQTGNTITISGVTGNTNINGTFIVVTSGANTYTLVNPVTQVAIAGNGTFGGSPVVLTGWPTIVGQSITDGTASWANIGSYIVKYTVTSPSWTNATISATSAVVYDTTDSNRLLFYIDLGSVVNSTNGTFSLTIDASGLGDFIGGF